MRCILVAVVLYELAVLRGSVLCTHMKRGKKVQRCWLRAGASALACSISGAENNMKLKIILRRPDILLEERQTESNNGTKYLSTET